MQIAENNWVRRICKVTQEDRRKTKEFLCSCEISRKDIVSMYISLKCSFEHKNSLIQG